MGRWDLRGSWRQLFGDTLSRGIREFPILSAAYERIAEVLWGGEQGMGKLEDRRDVGRQAESSPALNTETFREMDRPRDPEGVAGFASEIPIELTQRAATGGLSFQPASVEDPTSIGLFRGETRIAAVDPVLNPAWKTDLDGLTTMALYLGSLGRLTPGFSNLVSSSVLSSFPGLAPYQFARLDPYTVAVIGMSPLGSLGGALFQNPLGFGQMGPTLFHPPQGVVWPGFSAGGAAPGIQWNNGQDSGTLVPGQGGVGCTCQGGTQVFMPWAIGVGGTLSCAVKKPVIYLYPTAECAVSVGVALPPTGRFSCRYPEMVGDRWRVVATPDGKLRDSSTGRGARYLFWEAEDEHPFVLERSESWCIPGSETRAFLEAALLAHGLDDFERTDFLTYWLPSMELNPYNQIQFLSEEYDTRYQLKIEPAPDTVVRIFMIFQSVSAPVDCGAPALPSPPQRRGFTVVEWGGSDLSKRAGHFVGRIG